MLKFVGTRQSAYNLTCLGDANGAGVNTKSKCRMICNYDFVFSWSLQRGATGKQLGNQMD